MAEHLWIKSEVAADGSYVVSVEAGEDCAIPLDRAGAQAYAMAVLAAAMYAEHDAAVLAQYVNKLGLSQGHAIEIITELRERRAPVDDAATAPLRFLPGVSLFTSEPFIHLFRGAERWCQLAIPDAVEHALFVLRAVTAVEVDGVYFRYLTGELNIPEGRARAVVEDVGSFYKDTGIRGAGLDGESGGRDG